MAVIEKYKLIGTGIRASEERKIDVIKYNSSEYKMRVDGKKHYDNHLVPPDDITNTITFLVQMLKYKLYALDDERMDGSPVPWFLLSDESEVVKRVRRRRITEDKLPKRVRRRR